MSDFVDLLYSDTIRQLDLNRLGGSILYLQKHFDSEYSSEGVIHDVQHGVVSGVLIHRVLRSEGYTAGTDDDHNEWVEIA